MRGQIRRPVERLVLMRLAALEELTSAGERDNCMAVLACDVALRRQYPDASDDAIAARVASTMGLTVSAVQRSLTFCTLFFLIDELTC